MKKPAFFRFWSSSLVLAYALALLPLLYLIYHVEKYGVDVPYMDEWSMVSTFEQYYGGSLRIIDLTAPHLEHRPFFPRTMILSMGTATGWNIKYELRLNIALAALAVALLCVVAWQIVPAERRREAVWLFPLLSLVGFSLRQSVNWLWGWQIAMFLNLFAVVSGLTALRFVGRCYWLLIVSMLFGVVATWSFANGLLFWPIGLIVLAFASFENGRRKALYLCCFISVGSVACVTYFSKHVSHPYSPQFDQIAREPLLYLKYIASYLGSPMSSTRATKFGTFGITIAVFTHWAILTSRRIRPRLILPFTLLILYAIGSALGTCLSRGGLGIAQATSPRYVTFGNLLWLSNLALLFFVLASSDMGNRRKARRWTLKRWVSVALIIATGVVALRESVVSKAEFKAFYERVAPARQAFFEGHRPDLLKEIHPNPAALLKDREILRRHRLSVFRDFIEPPLHRPRRSASMVPPPV